MSNTNKAVVAKITLGGFTFDGLLIPNGEYRIATSQLVHLNLAHQSHSARDVKTLLGKDCQLTKVTSELNPNPVSTISITEFSRFLILMSQHGHQEATNILLALSGLSLTEVFNYAFGKESTARERKTYLEVRLGGKIQRRSFTDSVKAYNELTGSDYQPNYAFLTNLTYMLLFDHTASELEAKLGKPVRDNLSPSQVSLLDAVERLAGKQVQPEAAIRRAVELLR